MFDQPGRKIKTYAIVMFLLTAVLVGVGVFVFLITTTLAGEGSPTVLLWCILICAVLLVAAYLGSLFLCAMGDVVEETAQQTELFKQNNDLLRRLLEGAVGTSNAAAPAPEPEPMPGPEPASAPEPTPVPVIISTSSPRSHATVRCPKCGTPQGDARETCYNCGAPLKSE